MLTMASMPSVEQLPDTALCLDQAAADSHTSSSPFLTNVCTPPVTPPVCLQQRQQMQRLTQRAQALAAQSVVAHGCLVRRCVPALAAGRPAATPSPRNVRMCVAAPINGTGADHSNRSERALNGVGARGVQVQLDHPAGPSAGSVAAGGASLRAPPK